MSHFHRARTLIAAVGAAGFVAAALPGAEVSFVRRQLDTHFYSEGVAVADVDGDGHPDIIAGPYWFAGPEFTKRSEIRAPLAYDPESYSDTFLAFARDFDGDARPDLLQIGWPGHEATWSKNPGKAGGDWPRQRAFSAVGAESPAFLDLVGDGQRQLVFVNERKLGWAEPDLAHPEAPWRFHAISPAGDWQRYTHGLGVGDVNSDGRPDLVVANGWYEHPPSLAGDPVWTFHPVDFGKGGAQIYVYDVNGDGRPDVITSIEAHQYGLSWFEQLDPAEGKNNWREHVILSRNPAERLQGVQFSQLHALVLADIDGDGLKDIVVGKRYWAHGSKGDPDPGGDAVLYWFRLIRENGTVRYEPHLIDDHSGVGAQFEVADLNGDGLPDIAISNKHGVFVFFQHRSKD